MERVRREVRLGRSFSRAAFERAVAGFRTLYNVAPDRILCAPDVLVRYAAVFVSDECAHARSEALRYAGIPIAAAILAAGTLAVEGEVDSERMGDW